MLQLVSESTRQCRRLWRDAYWQSNCLPRFSEIPLNLAMVVEVWVAERRRNLRNPLGHPRTFVRTKYSWIEWKVEEFAYPAHRLLRMAHKVLVDDRELSFVIHRIQETKGVGIAFGPDLLT